MAKGKTYDYLFNLVLFGDHCVGKTCILLRFTDSFYSLNIMPTIGIDFQIRTIELDGKRIKLKLWETSGQRSYKDINASYCRRANGIMFVYDVTDKRSFQSITYWIQLTEQHAPAGVERMLIGNRCDAPDRKVQREQGENLAREHGLSFFETSAKLNINVDEAFKLLVRFVKAKADANPNPPDKDDPKQHLGFCASCSLI